MNIKRIVVALASVLFSFLIAQAALAFDPAPHGVCLIAKCREGFSLDTKNCRCVSDRNAQSICMVVIDCIQGSHVEPKTCRCIKDKDLFEKADSSAPSKPSSGDPTTAKSDKPMPLPKNPDPKPIPQPKIPCPPQRLCYP